MYGWIVLDPACRGQSSIQYLWVSIRAGHDPIRKYNPVMEQQVNLSSIDYTDQQLLATLASLSHKSSQTHSPNWLLTVDAAMQELQRASEEGVLTSVLVEADTPRGWIAAEPQGHGSWEIHPLLVDPAASGRGYGRILVEDIERKMRSHGGIAAFLSTSDATHSTNLSDVDLYKDPMEALRNIRVRDHTHGHAYQFWQRVGFTIVGVIPDAEGFGVPSIHMAKRL